VTWGNYSNYPPGTVTGPTNRTTITLTCPRCERQWETEVYQELGGWYYTDEDAGPVCPDCPDGIEGVER
jgi:hypothetical protein